jgi:isochorismate hydrolase
VLSPVNPCTLPVNQHIEQGISSQMQRAFARFNTKLDELCEFNVGDLLTLRRWLLRVLPDVANAIEGQKMRPANRAMIDKRLGPPQGMQGLVIG